MKGLKRVSIHSTAEDFERKRERDRFRSGEFGGFEFDSNRSLRRWRMQPYRC